MTNPPDYFPILDMARGKVPESKVEATARRFKAARLALGKSQTQMARELGIDVRNINNWEKAVCEPAMDYAFRLLDVYGITLEYTYRGDLRGLPGDLLTELGKDNTKKAKNGKNGKA